MAARRLGYRVHTLGPEHDTPTGQIADVEIVSSYDDLDRVRAFAGAVDVVTFEFENIPAETLAAIESIRPVRPSARALDTTRHRLRELPAGSVHTCVTSPPYYGLRDYGCEGQIGGQYHDRATCGFQFL